MGFPGGRATAIALLALSLAPQAWADPSEDVDADLLIIDPGPLPKPSLSSRIRLSGQAVTTLAVDLAPAATANTVEVLQRLGARLAADPDPYWAVVVAGRLSMTGRLASTGEARGHALAEGEVSEAQVTWRPSAALTLTVGQQLIRWNATTLIQPLGSLGPRDLRLGPWHPNAVGPLAVPAVRVERTLGRFGAELVYIPFFLPHRVDQRGSDWAIAGHASSERVSRRPIRREATRTPTQDGLASASVGSRVTARSGPLDAALSWLYDLDRLPEADAAGRSEHHRRHRVAGTLSVVVSPVVLSLEGAWTSRQSYRDSASSASGHAPMLEGAFELTTQPWPWLTWTAAVGHRVLLDAKADRVTLDAALFHRARAETELQSQLRILLALQGRLRVDVRGQTSLTRADRRLDVSATWRPSGQFELTLGALMLGGDDISVLYEGADYAYLRTSISL